MTVTQETTTKTSRTSTADKSIVDRWSQLEENYAEANLAANFMSFMFEKLGLKIANIKNTPNIGSGLRCIPDYLLYQDPNETPVLVVEIKRRVAELGLIPEKEFAERCEQHNLYREAVGFEASTTTTNGIRQYLDISRVKPEYLAPYGLVFNGDFFQLWRRVDGLVFPLTPIQKVTKTNWPKLLKQLKKCLTEQPTAIVTGIWNMKGGVAKTTNTINIAATLALHSKKVLLIDLDPQGDLTNGVGFDSEKLPDFLTPVAQKINLKEHEAAQAILKSEIKHKTFSTSERQNFSLSLLSTNKEALESFRHSPDINQITSFIGIVELLKSEYDYIFIDTSPALDKLAQCVLYSCNLVMVPIDGGKAIRHALKIHQEVLPKFYQSRLEHQLPHGPISLGIVRSNWNIAQDSVAERELAREVTQNFNGKQYETRLRQYAQTEIASLKQSPVVCWRSSPISKLYDDLTNEVFLTHNFIAK
jgi:chromosome partitioning protein